MKLSVNKKILRLMLAALLMMPMAAHAVPAYRGTQNLIQPDGTLLTYSLIGDEHAHSFITSDGILLTLSEQGVMEYAQMTDSGTLVSTGITAHNAECRDSSEQLMVSCLTKADMTAFAEHAQRQQKKAMNRIPGSEFPTHGAMRGLVLLVDFADTEMVYDNEAFTDKMNLTGYDYDGATGSVSDYFTDQSMGVFTPQFDVVGPIKLSRVASYYGQNDYMGQDMNAHAMILEAVQKAHDEMGVDLSQYDYNDDGNVDFVYVYYAGYAESYGASPNTIWPHASNLQQRGIYQQYDGKYLERYACSSELKYTSGDKLEGIGTFCHEFSHVLGLPDMYNTRYANDIQMGYWDVMDQGNYNNESHTPPAMSAFERSSLGWLELVELTEPSACVELPELTQYNTAYRVSTANPDEFFTLENRQKRGWDAYLPQKGMMIIRVAYDDQAWNNNTVNSGLFSRYDLMEADGTQGTDYDTDLFPIPGHDMFTDYSSPSSLSSNGIPTEKGITNIKNDNGTVTFRFMMDILDRPQNLTSEDIGSSQFTIRWDAVDDAHHYRASIREELTADENSVILPNPFQLCSNKEYPASGSADISETLDEIFDSYGWNGMEVHETDKGVCIGRYGTSGQLTTPVCDLTAEDGCYTIVFKARSYPAKKVAFTVSTYDNENQVYTSEQEFQVTKTEQDIVIHATGGPRWARIVITSNKERLFITDLCVCKGHVTADEAWSSGPKSWTVDDIFDTFYTFTNLVPERTYKCYVQAMSDGTWHESVASDSITVVTNAAETGISEQQSTAVMTYHHDIAGRRVSAPAHGIYVETQKMNDGSVITRKVIR